MFVYIAAGFRSWWNLVRFLAYFFSIGPLFRTLFAGWRRDSNEGFEWWERIILWLIFLIFGFVVRLIVIVLGIVALVLSLALLPFFIVLPIRLSYEYLVRIGSIGKSWSYGYAPALHRYGLALYRGKDAKLYGRDETVEEVTRILCRDEKDNVLLVGAPGTGKGTIVAEFAKNVYRGLVPEKLKNREVIEVPLADMPMDRLQQMFAEARHAGNIVVVLHEPEKYVGMLDEIMPMLDADELQVIAVTSFEGYVAAWKEREDVLRFFERVDVPPLDTAETIAFLKDRVREQYRKLKVEEGVLEEIVRRTDDLVQTKTQPEKSLDLLEELAVGAKEITVADVDRALSEKTGVPLDALTRDEKQILLTLEDTLRKEVIGQEEAVRDVAAALRRARTGVGSKEKPIGSFLFLGPTGVGKTHTAETLANAYFGGEEVMTRFDMSEFALPGTETAFVEHLTLAVEERPYGLVFFDELEKADRAIWQTLLSVLDEGRLTAPDGHAVSFINTIIIATSNAGTALIETHPETDKEALMHSLIETQAFTPEFLNRFDDIVLFHPLNQEHARAVTRLLLEELNERLTRERGISVAITDALIDTLVAEGFDQENGARALRRAVQDTVENAVADAVLRDEVASGSVLTIV